MSWLASWLFNPLMMWIGAAAVLSPILIHLLNKRRFRIVEWAAMDFLLDADKKNRRRVRLENLILLLLRCLAMFLLGLLLARPFLPSQLAGILGQSRDVQRVILLDDSLSQQAVVGNQTAFDAGKDRLKQLLQAISSDGANDWLTLYLTSQPANPVIANEPVTRETVGGLLGRIDEFKCSELVARYPESLNSVLEFVRDNRNSANRIVCVFTDLRRIDWQPATVDEATGAPNKLLAGINELVPDTFLVDVGSPADSNLAITGVTVDDLLVAETVVRFTVSVANHSNRNAENVELSFRVEEGQPQKEIIASIPPGETRTAGFRHMFQHAREDFADLDTQKQLLDNLINSRITVTISSTGELLDGLQADSEAFYAARTLKQLPVLVVDGDPSSEEERSESWYLRGIGLPGTGLIVDTATAGELESIAVSKYSVIYLLNVDEISEDRAAVLRNWVNDGGGLVFMPGDQVRAGQFNQTFYRDGDGLSPVGLTESVGDPARLNWVNLDLRDRQHPAFRVALDEEVGMDQVEVFSWWKLILPEGEKASSIGVPLNLTDPDKSPAMAEKVLGKGRVVTFAFPGDGDWSMWAAHPTFVCVMWDLVNLLSARPVDSSSLQVGSPLVRQVDLTIHDRDVALVDATGERTQARAQSLDDSDKAEENVLYQVEFPPVLRRGFWQMELKRNDGAVDSILYSFNVDSREGDLRRVDLDSLPAEYFGKTTRVIAGDALLLQGDSGSSNEIWPQVLVLIAGVLALEQFLGWLFGKRRG